MLKPHIICTIETCTHVKIILQSCYIGIIENLAVSLVFPFSLAAALPLKLLTAIVKKQNKTKQNKTKQNKQNKTKQNKTLFENTNQLMFEISSSDRRFRHVIWCHFTHFLNHLVIWLVSYPLQIADKAR